MKRKQEWLYKGTRWRETQDMGTQVWQSVFMPWHNNISVFPTSMFTSPLSTETWICFISCLISRALVADRFRTLKKWFSYFFLFISTLLGEYHWEILTRVCYRLFIKTLKNHINLICLFDQSGIRFSVSDWFWKNGIIASLIGTQGLFS